MSYFILEVYFYFSYDIWEDDLCCHIFRRLNSEIIMAAITGGLARRTDKRDLVPACVSLRFIDSRRESLDISLTVCHGLLP